MKKHFQSLKNYFVAFIISIIISLPCYVLIEWINDKGIMDWIDMLFISTGFSVVAFITSIIIGQIKRKTKIKDIIDTVSVIAVTTTIMYCGFIFIGYLFRQNATTDWEHWFFMSISLTVFYHFYDKYKTKNKNSNELVVAAEYATTDEAKVVCTILENNGINTMIAEKGNPMYIKNDSQDTVQVQVLSQDLQRAKELL